MNSEIKSRVSKSRLGLKQIHLVSIFMVSKIFSSVGLGSWTQIFSKSRSWSRPRVLTTSLLKKIITAIQHGHGDFALFQELLFLMPNLEITNIPSAVPQFILKHKFTSFAIVLFRL